MCLMSIDENISYSCYNVSVLQMSSHCHQCNTLFTRHKNNRSVPKITEPYRARNRAGVRLHYIKNNRAESIIEGVIEHVRISISALQLARASSMATLASFPGRLPVARAPHT